MLSGCVAGGSGFGTGERVERETPDPVPVDRTADCPPPPCPDGDCAVGAASVVWTDDGARPCDVLGDCDADYRAFLALAADEGEPTTVDALRAYISGLFDGGTDYVEGPVGADELRDVVIETTNVGFLLDGIEGRTLIIAEVERSPRGGGTQVEYTLSDPWVGDFGALLLLPAAAPPYAGVVAHPGHWEDAVEHRDLRHADALLDAGFAVAILDPRAHEADRVESDLTEAMLVAGHTFMAVRVYETLLLRRLLAAHPDVHPERIALQGHSGGSSSGNLAVRLDDGWAAYASDFLTEYLYATPEWEYVDETVPELHAWFPVVNDLDTVATPTRLFEYGFPEGGDELAGFFCDALD